MEMKFAETLALVIDKNSKANPEFISKLQEFGVLAKTFFDLRE